MMNKKDPKMDEVAMFQQDIDLLTINDDHLSHLTYLIMNHDEYEIR